MKNRPERQQTDDRQHAAEQTQRRLHGHHRHHQSHQQRGDEDDVRRRRKHPRRVLGDDHVLAQEFYQVEIRLPDARAAAVLQFGLPVPDATGDQRRQQQQQRRLQSDG
jgi:hypothetical protein